MQFPDKDEFPIPCGCTDPVQRQAARNATIDGRSICVMVRRRERVQRFGVLGGLALNAILRGRRRLLHGSPAGGSRAPRLAPTRSRRGPGESPGGYERTVARIRRCNQATFRSAKGDPHPGWWLSVVPARIGVAASFLHPIALSSQ